MITTITVTLLVIAVLAALLSNQSTLRYVSKLLFRGRRSLSELTPATDDTDEFAYFRAMQESLGGSRLLPNNQVTLLNDGPETYAAMLEAIAGASNNINIESYTFNDDEVGQRFADALINKTQQGVQVNLLYDAVGSFGVGDDFLQRLRAGGVTVESFQSAADVRIWRFNQRDHRKILIVDGMVGFIGGINICAAYLDSRESSENEGLDRKHRGWRDIHTQVEGPIVAELQQLFLRCWLNAGCRTDPAVRYFPDIAATGSMSATIVASDRLDVESRIIDALIGAIQIAKKKVWITQAYFVPPVEFVQALVDAAQRGVDVRVLVPSFSDHRLVIYASHAHYDTLLENGVKVYRYQPRILHAKVAVVDGIWSTVGSSNLDLRSLELNSEANVVVIDKTLAHHMEQLFLRDQAESEQLEPGIWRNRGLWQRFKERGSLLLKFWM